MKVKVEVGEGSKQHGTIDCGLFAIANCVALASSGILPKKLTKRGEDESTFSRIPRKSEFNPIPPRLLMI